jgi:hypothetical protein
MQRRLRILGAALFVLAHPLLTGAESRHAGSIHSVEPSTGILVLEERVRDGDVVLRSVDYRGARVVRLERNPRRPREWIERPTAVHRLPSETYVVVIGTETSSGVVRAIKIEAPVPTEEAGQ